MPNTGANSGSLWARLGFSQNPYFTTPIEISDEGQNLFVGRAQEVRRIIGKWDDPQGAITVVGGNIGTGKTSFLNVCQYLCLMGVRDFQLSFDPPFLIPAYAKVQLETGQEDQDLLLRVLRAAAESIKRACAVIEETVPPAVDEVLAWLDSLTSSCNTTTGGGLSGGMAGLSTGMSFNRSEGTSIRGTADVSRDALVSALARLAAGVKTIRDYRGIIVAVNNIEMVESSQVVELLNRFRDTLFAVEGVWWVLIGQRGLYDLIEAEAPRVAQRIKGTETTLEGLSWEDFHLAIQARVDHFKTRTDAVPPVGDGLLRALFDASNGEIRYVFKMADDIVTDALATNPSLRNVPPEMAESMLRESVRQQLDRLRLSERERRVLRLLTERRGVRPREYKDYGFQNAPHFIQTLHPLQEKGLVSKSTQGNAALYGPRSLAGGAGPKLTHPPL
jgi:hypothetical protein